MSKSGIRLKKCRNHWSPLPENLEESMARVYQMYVINITDGAVDLDETPQVCVIDTTDVDNILPGTDSVEKPDIAEKLGKLPGIRLCGDSMASRYQLRGNPQIGVNNDVRGTRKWC